MNKIKIISLCILLLLTNKNIISNVDNLESANDQNLRELNIKVLEIEHKIQDIEHKVNHIIYCVINNLEVLFVPSAEIQLNRNLDILEILYANKKEILAKISALRNNLNNEKVN